MTVHLVLFVLWNWAYSYLGYIYLELYYHLGGLLPLWVTFLKSYLYGCWRSSSAVKNTCCSHRGCSSIPSTHLVVHTILNSSSTGHHITKESETVLRGVKYRNSLECYHCRNSVVEMTRKLRWRKKNTSVVSWD